MTNFQIDWNQPIMEQCIAHISSEKSHNTFNKILISTSLIESSTTQQKSYWLDFKDINNISRSYQSTYQTKQEIQENQEMTYLFRILVNDGAAVMNQKVMKSKYSDEQVQISNGSSNNTFVISTKHCVTIDSKDMIQTHKSQINLILKQMKQDNAAVCQYFRQLLKLQDEEEQVENQEQINSIFSLSQTNTQLSSTQLKHENKLELTQQCDNILQQQSELKIEQENILSDDQLLKLSQQQLHQSQIMEMEQCLRTESKVADECLIKYNINLQQGSNETDDDLKKEITYIKYYSCYQNIYYYFKLQNNLFKYLQAKEQFIQNQNKQFLLKLLTFLIKAFAYSQHINYNFTNHIFRNFIHEKKLQIQQLINILLQFSVYLEHDDELTSFYQQHVNAFMKQIDQRVLAGVYINYLESYQQKYNFCIQQFGVNFKQQNQSKDDSVFGQLPTYENLQKSYANQFENMCVSCKTHLMIITSQLNEIQRYFQDIYIQVQEFNVQLEELQQLNFKNIDVDGQVQQMIANHTRNKKTQEQQLQQLIIETKNDQFQELMRKKESQLYYVQGKYLNIVKHYQLAVKELNSVIQKSITQGEKISQGQE